VDNFYTRVCYNEAMNKKEIEPYIEEKKNELMWGVASQGYNSRQIAYFFGISRSQAHNIMQDVPKNYKSPWSKK